MNVCTFLLKNRATSKEKGYFRIILHTELDILAVSISEKKTLLFPWFAKENKNVRQTKFQGLEYYYNLHKNLAFLFASNSNLVFRIVSPKNVSLKVKRSRYVKLWQLRCFSRRDGHKQQLFRGTAVGWEKYGLQDIGLFLSKWWPTNWKSHDPCLNFS